jgi:DNA (cytosine-5)-methyltransferase 1
MPKPLLLDLFCGAGGAGEGYARAGFRVVGVDLDAKPLRHNPHETYQGDALAVLDTLLRRRKWKGYRLSDFDAIHASPPCQEYSALRSMKTRKYAAVLPQVRERLRVSRVPWVVENVERAPMHQGVMICGTALGLNVRRHRLFDSSHFIYPPGPCRHHTQNVNAYGHGAWNYERRDPACVWTRKNSTQRAVAIGAARAAFEVPWMTRDEMAECIPPAYTQWIGRQLLPVVMGVSA